MGLFGMKDQTTSNLVKQHGIAAPLHQNLVQII
jgi:hypothetical protein